ncbi:hypothetical protein KB206_20665 [Microvirga sp. STS02]|uniref:hypothetical protein n=1 Tax=Hymenobacter negativus TaxID=2795026 RepID=UPI0018DC322D|nr:MULTISPECIES: hypothetical protein [Bacteria]MBH8571317.1 hypothetical protein [Hymenobacter negativus]MBR7211055.1 hypothetical protein [Microvirga sp. STS02]
MLAGPLVTHAQMAAWQTAVALRPSGTNAQDPDCSIGSPNTPGDVYLVSRTVFDARGDSYLAGVFKGTVRFGAVRLVSTRPASYDVFVAKWSRTSQRFAWAQRAGGLTDEENGMPGNVVYDVAVRGPNVYVAGYASDSATFGSIHGRQHDASGLFLAKLTQQGTKASFTWIQPLDLPREGISNQESVFITATRTGIYLAGTYNGLAHVGPFHLSSADQLSRFNPQVLVAKLSDVGRTARFAWARQTTGTGHPRLTALAVDGADVYIAGNFHGTAAFGANALTSTGAQDLFVAKLSEAGPASQFRWSSPVSASGGIQVKALAVSKKNVYIAGAFNGRARFGDIHLENVVGAGNYAFVAKLTDTDTSGRFAWAQQSNGAGNALATGLAVLGQNVYVAGTYVELAHFGTATITSAGQSDVFVCQYTDTGSKSKFVQVMHAGGLGNDYPSVVAASPSGGVSMSGIVTGTARFGKQTITNLPGQANTFLAMFHSPHRLK